LSFSFTYLRLAGGVHENTIWEENFGEDVCKGIAASAAELLPAALASH
jgi:hypothetical protein